MKNKISLDKVRKRINIDDYTTVEYSKYLRKIDNLSFCIKFKEDDIEKTMTVKISSTQFAHLTGFRYAYDKIHNKQAYSGKKALNTMKTMSFQT